MAQSVIAEPRVDLHTVALGLEAAGYTITGVLETRLTVGTLHTTTNPVIVLMNDQALQCIVVEMVPEQSPQESLPSLPQMSGEWQWRAIAQALAAPVVQGGCDDLLAGDVLASEPVGPRAFSGLLLSFAQRLHWASLRPTLLSAAERAATAKAVLSRAYVSIPGAVAHYVTLALLGGFSGYFLHSLWLLPVVPLVYVFAVAARLMWYARVAREAPYSLRRARPLSEA